MSFYDIARQHRILYLMTAYLTRIVYTYTPSLPTFFGPLLFVFTN